MGVSSAPAVFLLVAHVAHVPTYECFGPPLAFGFYEVQKSANLARRPHVEILTFSNRSHTVPCTYP